MTTEVTTLDELRRYQRRALIRDIAKILKVTTANAGSQRQLRRLFIIAGLLKPEGRKS
jgi:hypothetical protein